MELLQNFLQPIGGLDADFFSDLSRVLQCYVDLLKNQNSQINPDLLMNFSQAAILLQNSCNVYGRNVDCLYQSAIQLMDLMDSRKSAIEGQKSKMVEEPRSRNNFRKQRNLTIFPEDFTLLSFSFREKEVKQTGVKSKKHVLPLLHSRLVTVKSNSSDSFYLYDQRDENIGLKKDFRVTWSLDANCKLCEENYDQGLVAGWSIFEGGISLAATPESIVGNLSYDQEFTTDTIESNSENHSSSVIEEQSESMESQDLSILNETSTVDSQIDDSTIKNDPDMQSSNELSNVQIETTEKDVQNAASSGAGREEIVPNFEEWFAMPKIVQKKSKNVIPVGFLFSHVLRHSLDRSTSCSKQVRSKKMEKFLIQKQISDLVKTLSNREPFNVACLTEQQDDFLGFDEPLIEEQSAEAITDVCMDVSCILPSPPPSPNTDIVETLDSYETEVLNQMQAFYERKSMAPNTSDLDSWKKAISSTLENAKGTGHFDVHQCGSRIIDRLPDKEPISFRHIAYGLKAHEVCRYFMSSLMLANTGNVLLNSKTEPDSLTLKLITRERRHDVEKLLVPPSVGGQSSTLMEESDNQSNSCTLIEQEDDQSIIDKKSKVSLKRSNKDCTLEGSRKKSRQNDVDGVLVQPLVLFC